MNAEHVVDLLIERDVEGNEWVNDRGNTIRTTFIMDGSRYLFDKLGWEQFDTDQDAWYFGTWVDFERRLILTYAEGDLSIIICPTTTSFHAELHNFCECYHAAPWVTTIDADGNITKYYQDREALLSKVDA